MQDRVVPAASTGGEVKPLAERTPDVMGHDAPTKGDDP